MGGRLFTLMYHDVTEPESQDSSGFPGPGPAVYKVATDAWAEHLATLSERAPPGPCRIQDAPEGSWLLTFDDGGCSALEIGRALAELGWTGHFFVTVGRIGTPGFLDEGAIRELHALGHVIGTHSWSHPERMSALDHRACLSEWRTSRTRLEEIVEAPITVASVPGGYSSRGVAEAAGASGLHHLFTSEPSARPRAIGPCLTIGRFAVTRATSADEVAALAAGSISPRLRRAATWTAKRGVKRAAGPLYPVVRRALLSQR
jgi:peptidoglycan/xylan/chitin deacetylase (PgdA/CDA1 family)